MWHAFWGRQRWTKCGHCPDRVSAPGKNKMLGSIYVSGGNWLAYPTAWWTHSPHRPTQGVHTNVGEEAPTISRHTPRPGCRPPRTGGHQSSLLALPHSQRPCREALLILLRWPKSLFSFPVALLVFNFIWNNFVRLYCDSCHISMHFLKSFSKLVNFCAATLIFKMEENTQDFWPIMLYYFKKGKNATEMQEKICAVHREGAGTDERARSGWRSCVLQSFCRMRFHGQVDQLKLLAIKLRH